MIKYIFFSPHFTPPADLLSTTGLQTAIATTKPVIQTKGTSIQLTSPFVTKKPSSAILSDFPTSTTIFGAQTTHLRNVLKTTDSDQNIPSTRINGRNIPSTEAIDNRHHLTTQVRTVEPPKDYSSTTTSVIFNPNDGNRPADLTSPPVGNRFSSPRDQVFINGITTQNPLASKSDVTAWLFSVPRTKSPNTFKPTLNSDVNNENDINNIHSVRSAKSAGKFIISHFLFYFIYGYQL